MSAVRWRIHPIRVGVVLAPDRMTAVPLAGRSTSTAHGEIWSRPLLPPTVEGASWTDLASALAELREALRVKRGTLRIWLLPPLVQLKRIELPRLQEDALRRVLVRDAERYFFGVRTPQVVAAVALRNGRRSPVPYLATAVEARLLDTIFGAAAETGWAIQSVVPAHSAWSATAPRIWPELRHQTGYLVVLAEDGVEALKLERGRLSLVRRFPTSGGPEQTAEALMDLVVGDDADPSTPPIAVVGPTLLRHPLAAALESHGVARFAPRRLPALQDSPAALAACFAGRGRGLDLVPERVREVRRRRSVRASASWLAGAAALLLLSAGVELWGVEREVEAVLARRAALPLSVAEAMRAREAIDGLDVRLGTLASAEAGAARWSTVIAAVAAHLPEDAHLVGFRGDADSLVLEGVARQAARAFESLQKSPAIAGVRLTAPIRQEARDTASPVERFTLAARLGSAPLRSGSAQ